MSKNSNKRWNLLAHMASQKFSALIFCVFVLAATAFFLSPTAFSALTLAVVGLYTAFVGARSYSDGQSIRYGGTVNTANDEVSVVRKVKKTVDVDGKKEDRDEID